MTEMVATAAIIATGALVVLPCLPVVGRWGHAALTLPTGFAVYMIWSILLLALGVFSATRALSTAVGLGFVIAVTWWAKAGRGRIPGRDVLVSLAAVTVAAAGVVAITSAITWTRFSPDSMQYLAIAGAVERMGTLEGVGGRLLTRLVGVSLLHVPGVGSARYMASWTPLLGASGLVLTGWLGSRALSLRGPIGRWGLMALGSLLALAVTTNRVVFHLFYINSHMAFATFLVLGVGAGWYAAVTRGWVMLVPAGLGLAVLPLLRPEGVIVALLFIVALVVDDRLAQRHRWLLVTPLVAVTVLWHGIAVPPHVGDLDLRVTGPVVSNLAGVAVLVVLVVVCGLDRRRRIVPWAVPAMPFAIAGYVAVRAASDWEPLTLAISAMAANLGYDGLWTTFWWVTPLLFGLAAVVVRIPLQRAFVYPLATWPLALLMFSYLREGAGYRLGAGDSGNRMMMHVALVLVLYLILAAGTGARLMESKPTVSVRQDVTDEEDA